MATVHVARSRLFLHEFLGRASGAFRLPVCTAGALRDQRTYRSLGFADDAAVVASGEDGIDVFLIGKQLRAFVAVHLRHSPVAVKQRLHVAQTLDHDVVFGAVQEFIASTRAHFVLHSATYCSERGLVVGLDVRLRRGRDGGAQWQ